ncbi:endonuclease/exonuclease/phosphatase family protein, partial [Bifidobacterium animalis subsp. lactis]|uniref:endonuclease/exonuclease/phosphatase family protein n=1 Tax=Bifidobacterium animalis TaxID=28025 RepID=UPI000D5657E6
MIIALWVILVLLLVWISLSELPAGWDGHAPLPYLIALSPFAWIGITAVAIWSGCLREWPLMACAIVGLIASLLRKTAYYMNDLKTPNTGELIARKLAEKRESENLTISSNSAAVENLANGHFNVFTLNCRYGEANAHEIVNTVRTNDIAVLALQEMSPDLVTELHDAGLDDLLPFHQFGDPSSSDNGGFNGLWLRVEPAEQTPTGVPIPAADVPPVTLPVTSTFNITFASAHPQSPPRRCKD